MRIIHRLTLNAGKDKKIIRILEKNGYRAIESKEPKLLNLCHFEIVENEFNWDKIKEAINSEKLPIITRTEYADDELLSAEWLHVYPFHFCGYPMPDLTWEWKEISYTPEQQCKECGVGLCQKAPIHLKGEPKLGRNHFMGIFWAYDIFAKNEIFDILLQNDITGFEAWPAMHYKKKEPLTTIKQIKVTDVLAPGIIDDNLTREGYSCQHNKYLGLSRGMYKYSREIFKESPDLVKTYEWFGGGHGAVRFIIASSKFAKLYLENKWRGLSLSPIELV